MESGYNKFLGNDYNRLCIRHIGYHVDGAAGGVVFVRPPGIKLHCMLVWLMTAEDLSLMVKQGTAY